MAAKPVVTITLERFEELNMEHNHFKIQEAKILELLAEILELKQKINNKK
jgi:hypothetical protein